MFLAAVDLVSFLGAAAWSTHRCFFGRGVPSGFQAVGSSIRRYSQTWLLIAVRFPRSKLASGKESVGAIPGPGF